MQTNHTLKLKTLYNTYNPLQFIQQSTSINQLIVLVVATSNLVISFELGLKLGSIHHSNFAVHQVQALLSCIPERTWSCSNAVGYAMQSELESHPLLPQPGLR